MKRIGIIMPNSLEFIEILLKIWNDNDCAVIIDHKIPVSTALCMMKDANVSYCHIDSKLLNNISVFEEISLIRHEISIKPFMLPERFYNFDIEKYNDNDSVVLFSSGTTGKMKGIVHTYRSINSNADSIIESFNLCNDNILILKSLCHSSTLVGELLVGLKSKSKLYFAEALSINSVIDYIVKNHITLLFLNPSLLELIISANSCPKLHASDLRKIYVSGSILTTELLNKAINILPNILILNMYGTTETGPRITIQSAEDFIQSPGSVGKPISNVSIKLNICNGNKEGNILVKTTSLFRKYDNTVESFSSHNWFDTGDVGYFDKHGNLYVVGRKDNMIHNHSHNIYPEQLEETICREGGLKDCIIYMYDNTLMCNYMTYTHVPLSMKEILCLKNKLRLILPSYEIPQGFRFENITYNENGKKKRICKCSQKI